MEAGGSADEDPDKNKDQNDDGRDQEPDIEYPERFKLEPGASHGDLLESIFQFPDIDQKKTDA